MKSTEAKSVYRKGWKLYILESVDRKGNDYHANYKIVDLRMSGAAVFMAVVWVLSRI